MGLDAVGSRIDDVKSALTKAAGGVQFVSSIADKGITAATDLLSGLLGVDSGRRATGPAAAPAAGEYGAALPKPATPTTAAAAATGSGASAPASGTTAAPKVILGEYGVPMFAG